MVLRNHGIVICGETIEETLALAHSAVKACGYQVRYLPFTTTSKLLQKDKSCKSLNMVFADWKGNTLLSIENPQFKVDCSHQQLSQKNDISERWSFPKLTLKLGHFRLVCNFLFTPLKELQLQETAGFGECIRA